MSGDIERKLRERGIDLPKAGSAIANYVPVVQVGGLLMVSGQLCLDGAGNVLAKGELGREVTLEQGRDAARSCALNILAQARMALDDLDRVRRVVRLGGFVNAVPEFTQISLVMNGASDFMVEVFGDKGRHVRSTIGVASLPMDAAVEVEAVLEIAP